MTKRHPLLAKDAPPAVHLPPPKVTTRRSKFDPPAVKHRITVDLDETPEPLPPATQRELDRRLIAAEMEHMQKQIVRDDKEIAKLVARRDRHLRELGQLEQRQIMALQAAILAKS